jgi:hypothetical protein
LSVSARFRDLSLVLSLYQARVVLRQLTDYVLDDKPRSARVPSGLFIPRKGKPYIDYFRRRDPASMPALVNYALSSTTVLDPDVLTLYNEPDTTWEACAPPLLGLRAVGPDHGEIRIWPRDPLYPALTKLIAYGLSSKPTKNASTPGVMR